MFSTGQWGGREARTQDFPQPGRKEKDFSVLSAFGGQPGPGPGEVGGGREKVQLVGRREGEAGVLSGGRWPRGTPAGAQPDLPRGTGAGGPRGAQQPGTEPHPDQTRQSRTLAFTPAPWQPLPLGPALGPGAGAPPAFSSRPRLRGLFYSPLITLLLAPWAPVAPALGRRRCRGARGARGRLSHRAELEARVAGHLVVNSWRCNVLLFLPADTCLFDFRIFFLRWIR